MPEELRFERPHEGLAESYRSMVRELVERGERMVPFPLAFDATDFPAFLALLRGHEAGVGLPVSFVPNTTFWLARGDEVVAVSNLRHALTDRLRREGGHVGYGVRPSARRQGFATEILRRTLIEARALGLRDALLTCAKDNVGSVRAILRNGGRLESEDFIPERGEIVQRYWIAIAPR